MQNEVSNFERYALSSGITFGTTFIITLGGEFASGNIDLNHIGGGLLLSILVVAARAGVKAVVETWYGAVGDKKV